MAIVTYNDNGTIKVVKSGNYVVSTDADPVIQRKWVYIYYGLSEPSVDLGFIESSGTTDVWLGEINMHWPPNDYPVGTTGCV